MLKREQNIDGTVTVSAGHAFGLVTDEGVEVLVHIGIDTVTLAAIHTF